VSADPATDIPSKYDPKTAQLRWGPQWVEKGYFHSEPDPARRPYTIVIPPPNVTGALHMGHALNNTLQDVLVRWRRMQGYNALWMPGTDHAGIATQAVVERLVFAQEKKTRHDLGRDELVKRIWQWKDQYEARILRQLREMGCSADWQRTRFTLDEQCARAVRETFFRMFRDGYLYRGKRLVNWDPQLQTSVADDETYTEDTRGGFWTFKYPVNELPGEFIRFSTTRPETMLGDTAVCVHPDDARYRHLVGKTVRVPLVGRDIPIIADALLADPELGTGCVKVTPAHDPNDYECGLRQKLPMLNILNPDGTINANGGKFAGLDRYKAREAVVAEMETLGLFEGREDRVIPLKYSDRSKTPIEPYLSDQWFVRMGDRDDGRPGLAQLAIDAVTDGRVKFFPERYARTYLDWLGEKRDWCVSRQLWWGHRIPVWYADPACPDAVVEKALGRPGGRDGIAFRREEGSGRWLVCGREDLATDTLGADWPLTQEADVLDTWFSSALWPHSTLGWPGQTPELAYYYPTSTLVTSRDIITLWVARMVLTGLYSVGDVPFRHVYITPKILDGFGEGMSKSKGNGVDPLDIIDRYGTDAMRFIMTLSAGETQDSRLPVANVCPHCDATVPVKAEHVGGRTRKVTCPTCKQAFRPGGPWPADDPELPTARQASERFEQGRNFANKLWNAARFLMLNLDGYTPGPVDPAALPIEDRWILSRLAATAEAVTGHLEAYRYSDVARTLYDFAWTEFCDWYVEMSKGRLKDEAARPLAQRVLVGVLDGILRLVQPVMPFVAESIWHELGKRAPVRGLPEPTPAGESVVIAAWPAYPAAFRDADVEARVERMQELVRGVREVRSRYTLKPSATVDVTVRCDAAIATDFTALAPFVSLLAGVGRLESGPDLSRPPQSSSVVRPGFEAYVSLAGLIDPAAEAKRLQKQLADKRRGLTGAEGKLANEGFRRNASEEAVRQQEELAAELRQQIVALEGDLRELQRA
jgi:valyl-tRNA synthetase